MPILNISKKARLLLTSNGLSNSTIRNAFIGLLGKDPRETPTRISILVAGTTRILAEIQLIQQIEHFRKLECQVDMIELKHLKNIEAVLTRSDAICIGHGNPYEVRNALNLCAHQEEILAAIQNGLPYIGASGGSILPSPDLSVAQYYGYKKPYQSIDKGFGLTNFSVYPHFVERNKEKVTKRCKSSTYPVRLLVDGDAICVMHGAISHVSPSCHEPDIIQAV